MCRNVRNSWKEEKGLPSLFDFRSTIIYVTIYTDVISFAIPVCTNSWKNVFRQREQRTTWRRNVTCKFQRCIQKKRKCFSTLCTYSMERSAFIEQTLRPDEYKFLQTGINGPPNYVEIALGDHRRHKLSLETSLRTAIEYLQDAWKQIQRQFISVIGQLTARVWMLNNAHVTATRRSKVPTWSVLTVVNLRC